MRYLKIFEEFNIDDPFGEEVEYKEPTFLNWLKEKYPDETTWDKIKNINCHHNYFSSLEGIENLVNLKYLYYISF